MAPQPIARPVGSLRRLSPEQERQIQRQICKHRPGQLTREFVLCGRTALMLLVKQELGIDLPIRTMGEYLNRWGFAPCRAGFV